MFGSGKQGSLGGHERQAHSVAISRDGKTVLTGGAMPFVLVWDWPAGKLRRKIELGTPGKWLAFMDIPPDGKQAEIVLSGETAIRFFDLDSGRELPSPAEAHRGPILGMEIARDGKLVSTGDDKTIRVWDLATGRQLNEIRTEHHAGGMTLALTPDGRLLATATWYSGVVTVHDRDTGRLVRTIDTGGPSADAMGFTSEEGLLALRVQSHGRSEPFLAFWDVDSGREVRRLTVLDRVLSPGVLSPDGRLLVAWQPMRPELPVPLWDVTSGRARQRLPQKGVQAVVFSPDGRMLACGDSNGVTIWEIASGKERCRIDAPATGSSDVLSPDGRLTTPSGTATLQTSADRPLFLAGWALAGMALAGAKRRARYSIISTAHLDSNSLIFVSSPPEQGCS